MIRYGTPSDPLDVEATVASTLDAESYLVDPVYEPVAVRGVTVMVAIPAFNEAETVGAVVEQSAGHADCVVVIDDGSSDATARVARDAGATVIEHDRNRGYGAALQTAFTEAHRAGAAQLVTLDADGQHDPEDIPRLLEKLAGEEVDVAIGSRFAGGRATAMPMYRRVGLAVVNTITNLSLGVVRRRSWLSDTQSGYRAYSRPVIESLAADRELGGHMGASTDILYHAHRHGYRIAEVGTTIDYDVANASSQDPVSHGLQLIRNILRTVERERPVTVLGVPGFVSSAVGLGFAYLTLSNYIQTEVFPLGLALMSVFFVLAGIFAAFTRIILHSLTTHFE